MLSSDSLSVRIAGQFAQRFVRGRQAGDVEHARGELPRGEQAGAGEQRRQAGDGGEAHAVDAPSPRELRVAEFMASPASRRQAMQSAGLSISFSMSTTYC